MDEWAVDFTKITDSSEYQRDNTLKRLKVYTFYIGKHGPFIERVPADAFDSSEIDRRVSALRTHLQTLPR